MTGVAEVMARDGGVVGWVGKGAGNTRNDDKPNKNTNKKVKER